MPGGRPQGPLALVSRKKMPKKETEVMRQMRAAYLSLGKNRSYRVIAERFGYTLDWVAGISRAFRWTEDAKLRDSAIQNEFLEENRRSVTDAQKLIFASIVHDIQMEAGMRGIRVDAENGALQVMTAEDMKAFMVSKKGFNGIPVKDWKGMNDLLNALRRVVFEFHPTDEGSGAGEKGPLSGTRVSGDLNVQLIIEK